jgi:predicted outer membrane repeat protein
MKKFLTSTPLSIMAHGKFHVALSVMFLLFAKVSLADYTATISPLNVPLNTPTVVTMTITSGVNNLGAIQISIPSGVTGPATTGAVSLTPPGGKSWLVSAVSPTLISLRASGNGGANRLGIGESIDVVFTITITTSGAKVFTTRAYTSQNFTGNGTGVLTGDQPTINGSPSCPSPTSTLYVDGAVAVSGSGGSWACAVKELSDALAIANGNLAIKSVWVAKGTYKPTTGTDRNAHMLITRGDLKVLGGFNSGDVTEGAADPVANVTTISGDIGVSGDATDNSYHSIVVRNILPDNPLVIDGFVFKWGNANGTPGILLSSGGAIIAYDNDVATSTTLSRCVFTNNSSLQYGGALFTSRSNWSITGCVFTANTSYFGGAAFGWFSSPNVSKTVFANNSATHGGGYYGNFGTPEFSSCIFANNTAVGEGGGVYQNQSNMSYFNCLFANNSSEYSGAIHQHDGSASTIINSTFFANSASNANSWGGGAIMLAYNNCTTEIVNAVFYKNTNKGADNVVGADIRNVYNTVNAVSHSVLQANTTMNTGAANLVGVNPLFVNEASPVGGDAEWFTSDDGLRLSGASPAVNNGDNTPVGLYSLTTDLLGNARTVCVTVDRGAIEVQACPGKPAISQQSKRDIEAGVTGIVTNPFVSTLQVRYTGNEKATLSVVDVSGKPNMNNRSIGQGVTHIDATSWSKGMYQVIIRTESGKQMVFKVMKL